MSFSGSGLSDAKELFATLEQCEEKILALSTSLDKVTEKVRYEKPNVDMLLFTAYDLYRVVRRTLSYIAQYGYGEEYGETIRKMQQLLTLAYYTYSSVAMIATANPLAMIIGGLGLATSIQGWIGVGTSWDREFEQRNRV